MRFQITVKPGTGSVVEALDRFADQIPYAAAQAINQTLAFAQGQVRRELPEHFKVRSEWVSKGIRWQGANKRTLTGRIFSKDPFMALQELGGEKDEKEHAMAVPFAPQGGGPSKAFRGENLQKRTLRSRWPGNLRRGFEVRTPDGDVLILQRKGKRKTVVAYVVKHRVTVKVRWNFRERVGQIARQVLPLAFKAELASAVAKARPR